VHNIHAYVLPCNERNIPVCCTFTQLYSHQILLKSVNIWLSYCEKQKGELFFETQCIYLSQHDVLSICSSFVVLSLTFEVRSYYLARIIHTVTVIQRATSHKISQCYIFPSHFAGNKHITTITKHCLPILSGDRKKISTCTRAKTRLIIFIHQR